MGYLIKGEWHEGWYDTSKTAGEFIRADSQSTSGSLSLICSAMSNLPTPRSIEY